jgi:transcription elongation factor Elf1
MSLYTDNKYIRLISYRLRNFKQKRENLYNFSCPFCGDSKKNALKARGYIYKKENGLNYRCYNCGLSITMKSFLKRIDDEVYKQYYLENYKGDSNVYNPTKNNKFTFQPVKFAKQEAHKENYEFSEWCSDLPEDHFCVKYIKSRKIPEKFLSKLLYTEKYKTFVDNLVPDNDKNIEDDERLVIPFYDDNGDLIAVSGRALQKSSDKLRYVTMRTIKSDDKLVYGLERLDRDKQVKIVEGPVDSMFLDNCIASGDANLIICADIVKVDNPVLIWDNEARNPEIVKMMEKAIDKGHKIVIWPENIVGKDINEMILNGKTKEDIESIISSNTFSGLEAKAKFIFWKRV